MRRRLTPRATLWLAGVALAAPACAQAPSAAELRAAIDARAAEIDPYGPLLNDPDPVRQILAVEALLASGDPALATMALEAGMGSADQSVRMQTLRAYLGTGPSLSVTVEGDLEVGNYENSIKKAGAAIGPDGTAGVTYAVGTWDAERGCFRHVPPADADCLLRVGHGGVQVFGLEGWFTFQGALGDDGVVSGVVSVFNSPGGFTGTMRVLP